MSFNKKVCLFIGVLVLIIATIPIIIKRTTNLKEEQYAPKYKLEYNKTKKASFYLNHDFDYYLYSANDLQIKIDNNYQTLAYALNNNLVTYNEILADLAKVKVYQDGGSILYENSEIRLLECHKTDYHSIYIGDISMDYEEGFCDIPNNMSEFQVLTRTYKILNIKPLDNLLVNITLTNNKETKTVEIAQELAKDIQINKLYKFKFQYCPGEIEDNISSIFSNELVEIEITNEEINDEIINY